MNTSSVSNEEFAEILKFYDDEIDIFKTYLNDLGYSIFSTKAYLSDVFQLLIYLNTSKKTINIEQITKSNINDFLRRTQNDKEKTTRNRRLMAIRTFFKSLIQYDRLDKNPAVDIDSAKIEKNPIPTYLNDEELRELFDLVKHDQYHLRNKCILMLMGLAGLRVIEIHNLNITDIIRDERDPGIYVKGKGNKSRYIPLPLPLFKLMEEYEKYARPTVTEPKEINAFFTSRQGRRLGRRMIQKVAEDAFQSLKELPNRHYLTSKPLSSHKLRHSFGTRLVRDGVDLVTIKELMGHENLNTTQIYTHIENKQKQKAMRNENFSTFFN